MTTEGGKRTVAIVGGGLGGMAAAIRCQEAGIRATVFEKSPDDRYLCASRYTGGFFHIAMDNIAGTPDEVMANIDRMTGGQFNREMAETLAQNGKRTVDWLRRLGVTFIRVGQEGGLRNVLSPPGVRQTGNRRADGQPYWVGRSGDVMLRHLEKVLTSSGGTLMRGHRVVELVMDRDRCAGVVVENAEGRATIAADAVVIADGGFQSNIELLERFVTRNPQALLQRNARSGHGDGLKMAEKAGAHIVETDRFYGHLVHGDALRNDALWPYPIVDVLAMAGIVVDENGRRFCDEGGGGVYISNEVAKLDRPDRAFVVFDRRIWDGPGRQYQLAPNPHLPSTGARIEQAPTIAELAARLGLDAEALRNTVGSYNSALSGQGAFDPPRRRQPFAAFPVAEPPFMGFRLASGITYGMAGIRIDPQCRAVSTRGAPVPGLYVAGVAAGGIEGGGYSGYIGGLCQASILGMLAGEHISGDYLARPR